MRQIWPLALRAPLEGPKSVLGDAGAFLYVLLITVTIKMASATPSRKTAVKKPVRRNSQKRPEMRKAPVIIQKDFIIRIREVHNLVTPNSRTSDLFGRCQDIYIYLQPAFQLYSHLSEAALQEHCSQQWRCPSRRGVQLCQPHADPTNATQAPGCCGQKLIIISHGLFELLFQIPLRSEEGNSFSWNYAICNIWLPVLF